MTLRLYPMQMIFLNYKSFIKCLLFSCKTTFPKKDLAVHKCNGQVHDQLSCCHLISSKSAWVVSADNLLSPGPCSVAFSFLSPKRHTHLKAPTAGPGQVGGGHVDGGSFLSPTPCLAVTGHPGMPVSWAKKKTKLKTAWLGSRLRHSARRIDGVFKRIKKEA